MLKPILATNQVSSPIFPSCRSTLPGHVSLSLPAASLSVWHRAAPKRSGMITRCDASEDAETVVMTARKKPIKVSVVATAKLPAGCNFLDNFEDLLGRSLYLELVSAELDENTGLEKKTIQSYAHKASQHGDDVKYEASFMIPPDFGKIGGVIVTNEHNKEMFLADIVLTTNKASTPLTISCNSWVHSKSDDSTTRIFFTSKSYLPAETPGGLSRRRKEELEIIRGDGTGMRKAHERIYDYDTYNDLGDPENDKARPVLGGSKEYPYPRRCRTGRPRTKKDPLSETRSGSFYVPRDEEFSEVKQATYSAKSLRLFLHELVQIIKTSNDPKLGFPYFTTIDSLFKEGIHLSSLDDLRIFRTVMPRLVKETVKDNTERSLLSTWCLLFEQPAMTDRDKFSWLSDEEFTRQTLAGFNPLSIQLVTEFPLVSKLDTKIYGPPESEITAKLIEREIKEIMTAEEALKQKRLFMLDYHDLLLPYVHKVRELEDTTLYGSRTIFFLTPEDTLTPIAIELTRPASPTNPQWKRVFTPCRNATGTWLWKLAKAHVCAHDTGYHQLVSHWLRTHCCTEPYIIAANRQLSVMHPIYRLLHPHFRYTMEINALARDSLISAGGIIESCFWPGKYSMEFSSVAYDKMWRFDMEGLPADLIRRGMAVEDPTAEHGLRLTIEDYPYANDGLLIWSTIKQWVTDYVSRYYPDPSRVREDNELQSWWTEVRTKGHADKKDEPWWPALNTPEDLTHILTTIIWVVSGHHAAVNFGQYHYAGYFPNRPTIARRNMPVEDKHDDEFTRFLEKPEDTLLDCFPSQIQAVLVMATLDILSTHSPDEEYLGKEQEPAWADDRMIRAAFERFSGRMKEIEGIIDQRNADPILMNRCGAGILPYELLKPFSAPGVTGMGVPNSVSI